jgi:hypothetical protein
LKDLALTAAAMIPGALFWAMVIAGPLHGLVACGRQVLGWHGGREYLVRGTLDRVSVTFAFLAFPCGAPAEVASPLPAGGVGRRDRVGDGELRPRVRSQRP